MHHATRCLPTFLALISSACGTGGHGYASVGATAVRIAPYAHGAPVTVAAPGGSAATTVTLTVSTPQPAQPPVERQQVAAQLTAASVGDVDRRANYLEYLDRHDGERTLLGLDLSRRVRFRVVDASRRPVNDIEVSVSSQGESVSGRTHADGVWDLYPAVSAPQMSGPVTAHVTYGQVVREQALVIPSTHDGDDVVFQLDGSSVPPRVLDLGFMIDVTGSMGDELRYVNAEVGSIVERIEAESPGVHVRVGATFYRDRGDAQPIQMIPFTDDVAGFAVAMRSIDASGGGDYPEDMNRGFGAAMSQLAWSTGNTDRVLVLIADAPPQMYRDERYTYRSAMIDAAARGIRIVPVSASGADRTVEYLFRALGAFTSTPYVYLTDDSGIGGSHMEADTDRVAVERFNDMLTRFVLADLRGEGMHEPEMSEQ